MIIRVDENITIEAEVYFDLADREEGYDDDIRFIIRESGPKDRRIFAADETSFLLTSEQADQLAATLIKAAQESRDTPR